MSKKALSVLVADDEQGLRDLFRYSLEPLGFEVTTVSDGMEAVEMIAKRDFDLVTLDVHMPRMRGPEALEKIRQIRPQQKVIIVSSSSDFTYRFEDQAKQKGAVGCLFKPIALDELIAAMEQALGIKVEEGQP